MKLIIKFKLSLYAYSSPSLGLKMSERQQVFSIRPKIPHWQLLDETSSYVVSIIYHDERIPGYNLSPEINS